MEIITVSHNNMMRNIAIYITGNTNINNLTAQELLDLNIKAIKDEPTECDPLKLTSWIVMILIDKKDIEKYGDEQLFIFLESIRMPYRLYKQFYGGYCLVIGGNIVEYKEIFHRIRYPNNVYLELLKNEMYNNALSIYCKDLIDYYIMDESMFSTFIDNTQKVIRDYDDTLDIVTPKLPKFKQFTTIDYDDLNDIFEVVSRYTDEVSFTDILELSRIFILQNIEMWNDIIYDIDCITPSASVAIYCEPYMKYINTYYICHKYSTYIENLGTLLSDQILCLQDKEDLLLLSTKNSKKFYIDYIVCPIKEANEDESNYTEYIDEEAVEELSPIEVAGLKRDLKNELGDDVESITNSTHGETPMVSDDTEKNDI